MRGRSIQAVRSKLVKKMEELSVDLNSKIKGGHSAPHKAADPFDLAALETSRYVDLACRERERSLLAEIKLTIQRIDCGLYGVCDSCGEAIREERLLIDPTSRSCVHCQFRKERAASPASRRRPTRGTSYVNVG